ncbi:MAG: bifunctional phosphoribosylaminoimidazolecarboxamide formyltransferase/inosine monophosphate cyclohydrolase [Chloroflexi bacterium]|nr:bifunctional phosphoribosylaminoimidazolecarboxamide formyltransferase/inosine monophosphate cyclohydrolase [Chloroflexota bacterium]
MALRKVALCSVWDKTGLEKFCQDLLERGWTIMASGGTAAHIRRGGVDVVDVSEYAGSPEVLGGRVKTLHPAIHAGILARRCAADRLELQNQGWMQIDMVVANLYPFQEVVSDPSATIEMAIESIDVGGVALMRAAAKNYDRCTVVPSPGDYDIIVENIDNNSLSVDIRKELAVKAFRLTSEYDRTIFDYLEEDETIEIRGHHIGKLGYGENPHQKACLYSWRKGNGPLGGRVLNDKALSYNNVLDMDNAVRVLTSYNEPTAVVMKHNAPCGIASRHNVAEAVREAIACDSISAYGGVIAVNRILDVEVAKVLKELFVECIVAPGYEQKALKLLEMKSKCRLLELSSLGDIKDDHEIRSVIGGMLVQSVDNDVTPYDEMKIVSTRHPGDKEKQDLLFAWKACKHVKSNAIVLAKQLTTTGIGGGQPSRVQSVEIAIRSAGANANGSVMASDAFFPFPDGVDAAGKAGITAVIQPGGSIRDGEVLDVVNQRGMAMIHTGKRHFKH